jgi:hypothetical protein
MTTRCKPGDLAIILYDVPSCTLNIGRVVKVDGPPEVNRRGQTTWLIEPVTNEPYMMNDDVTGEFIGFMPYGATDLEQPDAWMMPIRPDADGDTTEEKQELVREREFVTCR